MEYEFTVEKAEMSLEQGEDEKEIIKSVKNILSTPKGSVPSARGLGVDMSFVDRNPAVAKTLCVAAVHEAMRQETRASVKSVTFETDKTGAKTIVRVTLERKSV